MKTHRRFRERQITEQEREALYRATAGYRYYDRNSAVSYARTYTNDDGTTDTTTNYNLKFNYYNPKDCQNYVSQCVWFGFGGVNEQAAINNHQLPMISDTNPATTDWCGDKHNAPNEWAGVTHFATMIIDNDTYDKAGVQGVEGSLWFTIKGDYISLRDREHVYFVTDWIGLNGNGETDFNELKVCGHTSDWRDRWLYTLTSEGNCKSYSCLNEDLLVY